MERRGAEPSATTWAAMGALLEDVDPDGGLDVALLLTPTGDVLAGRTREGLRPEVIGVMSATMTASVDTLLEELRGHRPEILVLEAGGRRFVVSRTADDNLLVMAAPSSASKRQLLASARALRSKLVRHGPRGKPRKHAILPPP
jgi:predicted regulator of Ras-like GTPase activity (Roadblock/LC7/MglB family)